MKTTAIVPTYNRSKMLVECVESILASNTGNLDVVIVDDCSPDDTQQRVKERFGGDPRVKYTRNPRNVNLAASRNNGAKLAKDADFLLFIDDDNIAAPDMAEELLKTFERHPKAALVAPLAIQNRPGKENLVWTLGCDFDRWTSMPRNLKANMPLAEFEAQSFPDDLPTTYSPNAFMVKRETFEQIGGFDESYKIMFEESDFGWRTVEAGFECWIAAKARTLHRGFIEPDCNGILRQLGIERPNRTFCFARNRVRFARRHFSFLQALSAAFVFAPLSATYYCTLALRHDRPDIAKAYLYGTVCGILGLKADPPGAGAPSVSR